jgi:2-oxo-4-hydroxy-4-carboxy-5-ureidoimidazoline decarboxylase
MPLDRQQFVARYGSIYERSAWVAERCYAQAEAISDPEGLVEIFQHCVDAADQETRLALIRAHPDLAGKAAIRGELQAESTEEQASAGIDRCSESEFRRFHVLNDQYHEKFGFPFVMAVKNSNRMEILAAFENRLDNPQDIEFATAISEIHKIARLRLQAMAQGVSSP